MELLIAIAIAVVLGGAAIVARQRRAPSHVVERSLRRVSETVPTYRMDEARAVRADLTERLEDERVYRQTFSDLAQAARERTASMDSAERVFGASRRFYGIGFALADFVGQSAVNWLTFAQRDVFGLVVAAAVWTAGPAFVSAFLAEGALRVFGRRRPDNVRQTLDIAALMLGAASLTAQLVIMVSRAAGFDLGPLEEVLPIVMNVVASAGGVASGLLLGTHRHLHAEARFNRQVAASERAIRVYGEGLLRLDELVPPPLLTKATTAGEPSDPASSAMALSPAGIAGNGHEPVAPLVPSGVPSSRSAIVRSIGLAVLTLGISSAKLSAQPVIGCAESYDASLSSSAPEMSEARRRVVASTPSFLNRFCADAGDLYVRRFGGDTLWQQQRHFVVASMPSEFRHCAKAQPLPARNRYAQIRREAIRGVAEGAMRVAVRVCTATADSIGKAVQRARQSLRDSVAHMLSESPPIRNENRSAIADQITQAIGRGYAATVIVTDLIENVRTEIDSIQVPEGMTIVLVLVPAADSYGGADATARWAKRFADRVKGITLLPYTELDNADFWMASPRFMQRTSGPSG